MGTSDIGWHTYARNDFTDFPDFPRMQGGAVLNLSIS